MSYILKDKKKPVSLGEHGGQRDNGNGLSNNNYRAKSPQKQLVKCSEDCQYPHIGIVRKNPKGRDIEAILLAGGFSLPDMPHGENGAFAMVGGV